MYNFYFKMAMLDDTNGNTLNINNSPGELVGDGTAPRVEDSSIAMLQSSSTDDLSQSLSEYTDADESISAPTELLAEFLSAVMIRDYVNALRYCKQKYEPNNSTARDFYPHILSKIDAMQTGEQLSGESDENYNMQCRSPLASSSSSPVVSRSPCSSNRSNYTSSVSIVSSSATSASGFAIENIDQDEVSMMCSDDESDESSQLCGAFSDSGSTSGGRCQEKADWRVPVSLRINSDSCQHISTSPRRYRLGRTSSRSCRSVEEESIRPQASLSENNTSQSYSSLLLEDDEKDLTLSDISNLNIEEEETSIGRAQETRYTPPNRPEKLAKNTAGTLISHNLRPASIFASRLVAILRSKITSPTKRESFTKGEANPNVGSKKVDEKITT
ncbi:uncharacterized protein LOC131213934 isoform X2 [Anopheles bellator]|uniref:uncharacterized protein LOC131213934 isoform X2 n=1 Tax=Anopheles bellator TaxID=139047 RepID=UPI0026490945|nr:uncharacterized protein LOC131213934 isoform X2 [Anopheles bellator]